VLRGASRAATAPLHRAYNETRVAAGLQRTGVRIEHGWYSPELVCVLGIAELDYPRRDLPEHVHYVGAIRTQQSSRPVPPWWPELIATDRAIVHVTQGTLDVTPSDLIGPSLEALALESVLVVAATGRGPATLPFATPANARVGGILPYAELLPRTTVMITNGGWGGVLSALSHGVPLIVAGGDIDKPEIAARVAFSGAGVDLRTGTPSTARIHEAYLTETGDARFAERSRALGGILAGHDAAAEVAAHCEALLASTPAAG
jgi:UDP:flavonoid glycosyltransferase YjiC (YdhE family)